MSNTLSTSNNYLKTNNCKHMRHSPLRHLGDIRVSIVTEVRTTGLSFIKNLTKINNIKGKVTVVTPDFLPFIML